MGSDVTSNEVDLKVIQFIHLIKKDYIYLLYNNLQSFPGCCHTVANQVTGYLNEYFDDSYNHIRICNVPFPHSWTTNGRISIDFTGFQYDCRELYEQNKFGESKVKKNLDKDELFEIVIKNHIDFPIASDTYQRYEIYPEKFMKLKREVIPVVKNKFLYNIANPNSLDSFLKYSSLSLLKIDDVIVSNRYYT